MHSNKATNKAALKAPVTLTNMQVSAVTQMLASEHCNYAVLYRLSEQLHPFLKQTHIPSSQGMCFSVDTTKPAPHHPISIVYQNLQQIYPTAGKKYWVYKCWQLAIWQPILLSFICVYALKASVPMRQLIVLCKGITIAGYQLPCLELYSGTTEALITHISDQCHQLISNFYQQINHLFPLKLRFCQRLLSDQLLSAMAKTTQYLPLLKTTDIDAHTAMWLAGFKLKNRSLLLTATGEIQRSSCCLEYQLDQADYCSNCPKEKVKNYAAT